MSLKSKNLRIALLSLIAAKVKEALDEERADHLKDLLVQFKETGAKSFQVRLEDDGEPVGALTLAQPADAIIEDPVALLAWAKEHAPSMVHEVVIPAKEEIRVEALYANSVAALKKRVRYDKETRAYYDDDLEVVGLSFKPGGPPTKFSVTFNPEGKDALMSAYLQGDLAHVSGDIPAPALEDAPPWLG